MAALRKRGKVWYYRYTDSDGAKIERKGCSDRRATEQMAAACEAEAGRVRSGLSDPKSEARRRQAARPPSEHFDDFHAHLLAKGGTAKHADLFVARARRVAALVAGGKLAEIDPPKTSTARERGRAAEHVAKLLGSARLGDLTPTRVQDALATLKAGGRSLATCNHHRAAIRAFSRWAWHDGRLADDALAGVAGFNAKEDRRHDRRTIGLADLRTLIEVAHAGPAYREMSGKAWALCYRLAAATGLRFSEIASITPGSFTLRGPAPLVTVAAAYTKNGDTAALNLPADLAADLGDYLEGIASDAPVFPLPDRGATMLRVDLKAAGIPYRDAGGLVFDFHALRCEHATLLDAAGVSPRVVQRKMRHSTLELTGRYTRPRALDLERAASALPSLRPGSHS